jgi:hypothetical protein
MATKAKSITAAELSKLTQVAVKSATKGVPGKFVGRGPTMGYILQQELSIAKQLDIASQITKTLTVDAKAAGITGLGLTPVVVARPGKIIAGFIAAELKVAVR